MLFVVKCAQLITLSILVNLTCYVTCWFLRNAIRLSRNAILTASGVQARAVGKEFAESGLRKVGHPGAVWF
jgi:hypothetical protein